MPPDDTREQDVGALLGAAPLGGLQITVLVLAFAIAAFDGMDAQIIAFAAPEIVKDFDVPRERLGPVFSSALVGMALGAFLFGPLGDRVGRKRVAVLCTFWFGAMTLLTVVSTSLTQLMVIRFITGLGLGGALPNAVTLVSEYAPARRRAMLVTIMYIGFAVGGVLGSAVGGQIIPRFGWTSIFWFGGLLPLALGVVLLFALPESLQYLARRGGRDEEIRRVLGRLRGCTPPPADVTFVVSGRDLDSSPRELFSGPRRRNTFMLWIAFFINLLVLFTLMNWLPTLLTNAGVSLEQALRVALAFNLGAIGGPLLLAWASDRYDPRLMLGGFFFCGALCFMAVGIGAPDLGWLIATGVLTGFFAGGAQVGLYPVATQIYPAAVRVTGVAWAQVWGRIGSIIGPWLGGLLLWLGLGEYFVVFGAPLLLAAVAIWMMRPASRADDAAQVAPAMASAAPSTRR